MFVLKDSIQTETFDDKQILELFKKSYNSIVNHKKKFTYQNVVEHFLINLDLDKDENYISEEQTDWFESVYDFRFIENLLKDDLEEIIFHSKNKVQLERKSSKEFIEFESELTEADFNLALETQCLRNGIAWNHSHPFASFKSTLLGRQVRLSLLHSSTLNGLNHKAFIRFIREDTFQLASFSKEAPQAQFVESLFESRENFIISGSTGSGKTSLLKALLANITTREHAVILEDTQELATKADFHTFMLSSESKEYSLKRYCEYAMRMRPDRLILGEMRGSEVVPFVLSMNNGHRGLVSTIHANSASDAITRIGLLFEFYSERSSITFEQIMKLASRNIDYVIHMEKKKIVEIIKVLGYSDNKIRFEEIYSSKR